MELPFLIQYGTYVWICGLLVVTVVGVRAAGRKSSAKRRALFGTLGLAVGLGSFSVLGALVEAPSIAAATPFHRSKGLSRYRRDLPTTAESSHMELEARRALARLEGDCEREADALFRHRRLEELQAHVASCPEACSSVPSLQKYEGRFRDASDGFAECSAGAVEITAHILAGQHERAANAVRARSKRLAAEGPNPEPFSAEQRRKLGVPSAAEQRARSMERRECIALALERRTSELARHLDGNAAIPCRILLADLSEGAELDELLADLVSDSDRRLHDRARLIAALLRVEADRGYATRAVGEHLRFAVGEMTTNWDEHWMGAPPPGLVVAVLRTMEGEEGLTAEQRTVRAYLRLLSAWFASLGSLDDLALRLAEQGMDELSEEEAQAGSGVQMRALIVLRAGRRELAEELLRGDQRFQSRRLRERMAIEGDADARRTLTWARRDQSDPFWRAFAERDGEGVARALRRNFNVLGDPSNLEVAAARITRGQGALIDWLDYGRHRSGSPSYYHPLVDASIICTAARRLEADNVAERHCARAQRIHRALLQRDVAIPLWMLDRI